MATIEVVPFVPGSTKLTRLTHDETLTRQERAEALRELRDAWTEFGNLVMRSAPRLRTADLLELLDEAGKPSKPVPWAFPLDIVWATDRLVHGRLCVFLAVLDTYSQQKALFALIEGKPGKLPILWQNVAGHAADFFLHQEVVSDAEFMRGLIRLVRNGTCDITRTVPLDAERVETSTVSLALQSTREGFAPLSSEEDTPMG